MKKVIIWILILLISISMIAVFTLTGCKEGEIAEEAIEEEAVEEEAVEEEATVEELTHIIIGLPPYQDATSLMVGVEKGFFKEMGLEPEFIPIAGEAAAELITARKIDFGILGDADIAYLYETSPHLRFSNLLYFWEASCLFGQKGQDWKSFEDFKNEGMSDEEAARAACAQLKGKSIIYPTGGAVESEVKNFTGYGGLDHEKDIAPYVIDMNTEEGFPAFIGGDGDVFFPGIPHIDMLKTEGYKQIIAIRNIPVGKYVLHVGFGTYKEFADKNFDVLVRFQAVIYKTLKYIEQNPMESFTIICDYLSETTASKLTPEELEKVYWNKIQFFPLPEDAYNETMVENGKRYWKDRVTAVFEQSIASGKVSAMPPDLEEIFLWPKVMNEYLSKYEPDLYNKLVK